MSDLTIPEEAIVAACNAYEAAILDESKRDSDALADHEEIAAVRAAAPLIVAAAMTQLADRLSDVPVELADLMGAGKQYNAGKAYVIGEMRRLASVLRGEGEPQ